MRPSRPDNPPRPVDLGWLFLLPGIALIAAGVLIAAEDDLYEALFRRDQALAIETRHAERVKRYEAYLEAVKRRDPTVVRSLTLGQLNAAPTDLREVLVPGLPVYDSSQVFASLEPPESPTAHRQRTDSVLARWATNDSSRVWLLASGALCIFVGLLPPVSRSRRALLEDTLEPDAKEFEGEFDPETEDDQEVEEELTEPEDADEAGALRQEEEDPEAEDVAGVTEKATDDDLEDTGDEDGEDAEADDDSDDEDAAADAADAADELDDPEFEEDQEDEADEPESADESESDEQDDSGSGTLWGAADEVTPDSPPDAGGGPRSGLR